MINWKDPIKELPNEGEIVWVLLQHSAKRKTPLSCEIYAGIVTKDNNGKLYVWNNDEIGNGSQIWVFSYADEFSINEDEDGDSQSRGTCIDAWCLADEIALPIWCREEA